MMARGVVGLRRSGLEVGSFVLMIYTTWGGGVGGMRSQAGGGGAGMVGTVRYGILLASFAFLGEVVIIEAMAEDMSWFSFMVRDEGCIVGAGVWHGHGHRVAFPCPIQLAWDARGSLISLHIYIHDLVKKKLDWGATHACWARCVVRRPVNMVVFSTRTAARLHGRVLSSSKSMCVVAARFFPMSIAQAAIHLAESVSPARVRGSGRRAQRCMWDNTLMQ
jgi:hypothetical protein